MVGKLDGIIKKVKGNRLLSIGVSTLLSGGVIGNGTLGGYLSNAARRALGMGLAELHDGQVHYFSKSHNILKRALIQSVSQTAYGMLRSYPRYLKYWEQRERDKHLQTQSTTALVNKTGQYYQLISDQKTVSSQKPYVDTIVGNKVMDYLELTIDPIGNYYDIKEGRVRKNEDYGQVLFVDLQPQIQVSTRNNIVLTMVQGRDYTRKEYISGGDMEISVSGKITSKYPDVYPEAEVSKFLRLMQFKGVLDCDNTILRQFGITQLIVLNYNLQQPTCRNVQPYSLQCVAVEPAEAVQVKIAEEEEANMAIMQTNKWLKWARFGSRVIEPTAILKLSQLWL